MNINTIIFRLTKLINDKLHIQNLILYSVSKNKIRTNLIYANLYLKKPSQI